MPKKSNKPWNLGKYFPAKTAKKPKKKTYGSFDKAIHADRVRRFKSRQQGLGELSFIAEETARSFKKMGKGLLKSLKR